MFGHFVVKKINHKRPANFKLVTALYLHAHGIPARALLEIEQMAQKTDWRSVPALAEIINRGSIKPTLTVHAIRHYVRFANTNGLAPHVRRLGKKILISESGFFDWLDSLQHQRAA